MFTSRALIGLFATALLSLTSSAQQAERGSVELLLGDEINPVCLQGPAPTLNSMWRGTVDGSEMKGAQGAMLLLSAAPWMDGGALDTEFGQILVDPAMAIYRLNRPLNDGRVMFGIPVPNDPALVGQKYYIQSLVYGYRMMQLCNGLEVTIGDRVSPPDRDDDRGRE